MRGWLLPGLRKVFYIKGMSFNGRFVLGLLQFGTQYGTDFESLVSLSGKTVTDLQAEDCKIDRLAYNAVLEALIAGTGLADFGLRAGAGLSSPGILSQLMETSSTVGEAMQHLVDFPMLACSELPLKMESSEGQTLLVLAPNPLWLKQAPLVAQQTAEGILAYLLTEYHHLTRNRHYPSKVFLMASPPADPGPYERHFSCPLFYGHHRYEMHFEQADLAAPVFSSNTQLHAILLQHARSTVAALNRERGFQEQVRQSVVRLSGRQFPTIEQVASHLNMSVRTLQRRLKEADQRFSELLEAVRHDFALAYLGDPELSVSEIAFLLGYADASAFSRSFKRWEGVSPKGWRRGVG